MVAVELTTIKKSKSKEGIPRELSNKNNQSQWTAISRALDLFDPILSKNRCEFSQGYDT